MVLPADMPVSGLIPANEYYLPPLKSAQLSLYERQDGAVKQPDLLKFLASCFDKSKRGDGVTNLHMANRTSLNCGGISLAVANGA